MKRLRFKNIVYSLAFAWLIFPFAFIASVHGETLLSISASNSIIQDVVIDGEGGEHAGILIAEGAEDVSCAHIVVVKCGQYGISSAETYDLENSIVYGNGTDLSGTAPVQTTNLVGVDPLFVDYIAGDYRLTAESPGVDGGTVIESRLTDIRGVIVPQDGDRDGDAQPDIGVHEYVPALLVVSAPGTTIHHVIIDGSDEGYTGLFIAPEAGNDTTVAHSAIVKNAQGAYSVSGEYEFINSIAWLNDVDFAGIAPTEITSLVGVDPLFVNAAAGDYNLAVKSPAIDTGTDLGYTSDLIGTEMPQDGNNDGIAACDIGPLERIKRPVNIIMQYFRRLLR